MVTLSSCLIFILPPNVYDWVYALTTLGNGTAIDFSETSLRRILHKDLGIMPYKVQLVQELKPIDHLIRFCFDLQKIPILAKKRIIFLDETHFDHGGYVSKQNCCIWGTDHTHTLKSRHNQNESLFGADFGPET